MGRLKTMSFFWTIVLIACAIFPFSTGFPYRSLTNYPPENQYSPGPGTSAPKSSPASWSPAASPDPSWPIPLTPSESSSPWSQLYPPALSPAKTRPEPSTPEASPSPWSQLYPPPSEFSPISFSHSLPPLAELAPFLPPLPALPYPAPSSPAPMPSSVTPYPYVEPPPPMSSSMPPSMPYPEPPSQSPILLSMPPYPSVEPPPPMPSSMPPTMPCPEPPSPIPSSMPPYPSVETPPPMPSSMPPTMPYPEPPSPPPIPSSMPPYPSVETPPPASMPPTMPYPEPPSPPPIPSSMPPYPSVETPPPASMPPTMPYPEPPPQSPIPSPVFPPSNGIKGGYWPVWIAQDVPPSAIPMTYFTHLFFAFASINSSTYKLSITKLEDHWMKNFTATLHTQTPPLKAVLSIGGDGISPDTFSKMVNKSENRAIFIESTVQVARKYGFDGLDFSWVFPATKEDMSNLALLFKEWREYAENVSKYSAKPRLLLSAAVYFSPDFFLSDVPRSYPGVAIRDNLDFVNIMNFDYHGSWDTSATAEHALLFDNTSRISTSYGMDAWPMAGVLPEKIVMGLPMYGRTWKLKDPEEHGIGAPAVGVGPGTQGVMSYKEIKEFNEGNDTTMVYDNATVSQYSYKGTDWIGYDGPSSIDDKIEYAKRNELLGYFFWVLGYDSDWELSLAASNAWEW
ncbi:class V chitinase CHIT5a-like [Pistacia vera]|uniref:class V chitinase CHIT5a-like n=1 Tax=Pistacia vera TaxID=55513 RepID=UPI001262C02F|nr:class V chitinase CHIT5a-like [Pistacia vera]